MSDNKENNVVPFVAEGFYEPRLDKNGNMVLVKLDWDGYWDSLFKEEEGN
jgi:hypothetical protein